MLRLFASYWYVFGPLFLAFNIGLGLLFVWIAERSFAAAFWQRRAGVGHELTATVALMFGLYSAFLAEDVWTTHDKARAAVLREDAAIRVLLRVAESVGPEGQRLHDLLVQYGRESTASEWMKKLDRPATLGIIHRLLPE